MPTTHTGSIHSLRSALIHEVGADVARADEGSLDLFHGSLALLHQTKNSCTASPTYSAPREVPMIAGSLATWARAALMSSQ